MGKCVVNGKNKTVAELKAILKRKGFKGYSKMKKAQLCETLMGASATETPVEKTPKKAEKVPKKAKRISKKKPSAKKTEQKVNKKILPGMSTLAKKAKGSVCRTATNALLKYLSAHVNLKSKEDGIGEWFIKEELSIDEFPDLTYKDENSYLMAVMCKSSKPLPDNIIAIVKAKLPGLPAIVETSRIFKQGKHLPRWTALAVAFDKKFTYFE
jgi:hypothetical protein